MHAGKERPTWALGMRAGGGDAGLERTRLGASLDRGYAETLRSLTHLSFKFFTGQQG